MKYSKTTKKYFPSRKYVVRDLPRFVDTIIIEFANRQYLWNIVNSNRKKERERERKNTKDKEGEK